MPPVIKIKDIKKEKDLLDKYKKGSISAFKALAEDGLALCISVAKKYKDKGDFKTLVSKGFSGWTKALEKYDQSKNYKFSTYSTWFIREEIHKHLGLKTK